MAYPYELWQTHTLLATMRPVKPETWFFGQFFDHGLDLVGKSSTSYVAIPIPTGEGDPLVAARGMPMLLNRTVYPATSNVQLTAGTNRTTPWVDQNQTYASAASKQVFLREYTLDGAGRPIASGRLLTSAGGAIADWGTVKAQAAAKQLVRDVSWRRLDEEGSRLLPRFPAIIASGRLGTVDAEPDRDGVVRRFGLYEDAGAWRIPSLPLTMGKGLGFEIPDERLVQLNWRGAPLLCSGIPAAARKSVHGNSGAKVFMADLLMFLSS